MTTKTTTTKTRGTCPACFRSMSIKNGAIVRHGWSERGGRKAGQIGNAWHTGRCFGAGYAPFEVSPAGTVAFIDRVVAPAEASKAARLEELAARPVLQISIREGRGAWSAPVFHSFELSPGETISEGLPRGYVVLRYETELARETKATERELASIRKDLEALREKAAGWASAEG